MTAYPTGSPPLAQPTPPEDWQKGLDVAACAELDAFREHLERHREANNPDCRFCRERGKKFHGDPAGPLDQQGAPTNGHKPFEDSEVDAALIVIDWWVKPRKSAAADLFGGSHSLNDDMQVLRDLIVRMSAPPLAQPTPEETP
jgi:hypothetical protein